MKSRTAIARISKSALLSNLGRVRTLAGNARVCAVVKADAYGHGAVEIARWLEEAGVDYLAVALLEEAIELRDNGIKAPLLVLSTADQANADDIVRLGITQTVYTAEVARALSEAAVRQNRKLSVHLKIDTGMHRLGVELKDLEELAQCLTRCPGLDIEGVYSHFAEADNPDKRFSFLQLDRLHEAIAILDGYGIRPRIRHMANSAGLLYIPESRLDMVRPGVVLYGCSPGATPNPPEGFTPVMKLSARISFVRTIEAGESVSYGRIFIAQRKSRIALLPLGYADGYPRGLSNVANVLVRGKRAKIAGLICMDQCLVDITDIPEAVPGDEATLFGLPELPVGELSRLLGTVDYEMTCGISKRVPRISVA